MSLQDVADAVGASKAHIWDLERGASQNPSMELLVAMAKAFKVSVAELIGEATGPTDANPEIMRLYSHLKELSPDDIKMMQAMAERLQEAKRGGKR
jgi:transcriptional regulator with XRE-family HTH domain